MKAEKSDVRTNKGIKFPIELIKAIDDLPMSEGRTFSAKVLRLLEIGLERYKREREIIQKFDQGIVGGGLQIASEGQIPPPRLSEEDNRL